MNIHNSVLFQNYGTYKAIDYMMHAYNCFSIYNIKASSLNSAFKIQIILLLYSYIEIFEWQNLRNCVVSSKIKFRNNWTTMSSR